MNTATHTQGDVLELVEQQPASHQAPAVIAGHDAQGTSTDSRVFFQVITAAAANPQVDIEKMERLWAMHERLVVRDAEQAFNAAMQSAQSEMGRISTDATNQQTRSKYATYGQLDRHLRPIYTSNGFALSFDTAEGAPDGHQRFLAYVSHTGGHTRTYRADVPSDGKGAKGGDVMTKTHAFGSASSYGMRYMLKMIFNVAIGEDDDDGNAAGARGVSAVEAVTKEAIANKMLETFMADITKCDTDAKAAQHWATGSKALHAAGDNAAYDKFKKAVLAHRNALKNSGVAA